MWQSELAISEPRWHVAIRRLAPNISPGSAQSENILMPTLAMESLGEAGENLIALSSHSNGLSLCLTGWEIVYGFREMGLELRFETGSMRLSVE